jgi:predicted RND superfamily exporter protein
MDAPSERNDEKRGHDDHDATGGKRTAMRALVERIVDFSSHHPLVILALALVAMFGARTYTQRLELRSDFRELLPLDSPGLKAYEHQLGRVGGGASLIIVVESPDRKANERFIDDMSAKIKATTAEQKTCTDKCAPADEACKTACGPVLISYVEDGSKEVRQFYEDHKWLYADQADLESADDTLDHQIAIKSGLISDLGDDDDDSKDKVDGGAGGGKKNEKKPALGMDEYRDRWKKKANKNDDFPTGYFATPDGTMLGLRIISPTTGTGDSLGDKLMEKVKALIGPPADLKTKYHPQMEQGFAGDVPNAIAEKDSIMSEALVATAIALALLILGIVVFFRSPWCLPVILMPAFLGVGAAYSFATYKYGYVNTSGAFLGAIILGNGINYPIVLLSRYREFRARGMEPAVARRAAVWNAFRAELVGAAVASIAYGSLTVTDFRGFSQFGVIGFCGMLLVWASIIPVVPAMLVIIEWIQSKLPKFLRDPAPAIDPDGSKGFAMKLVARVTERMPKVWLALAAVVTVVCVVKLPGYIRDPWEYNFDRLGSRGSKSHGGVGEWSNKSEKVFGGKMNVAGARMLADSPEQVPLVKAQMFENDKKLNPDFHLIAEIATVADLLPGTPDEQKKKLEVLDRIRDRITPRVLEDMPEDERARLLEIKPPDDLHVITAPELPPLLRRRFQENDGRVGTVFYVKFSNDISFSNGHNLLKIAATTDNVRLEDGTVVQTASRSTIFAEMIRAMEKDGPRATMVSFIAVMLVVVVATASRRGATSVLMVLVMGVIWTVGGAALADMKLNFLNFIALPITFGIGCEYPFNVFDRSRLLDGNVSLALKRTGGAVALCSYTTIVGYGSMLFADNQALQSFGRLAMSGELATLIGAMIVLPSLLHVWRARKEKAPEAEIATPATPGE